MKTLETRIEKIEQRNQKVEADKSWETSWTRKTTYCDDDLVVIYV